MYTDTGLRVRKGLVFPYNHIIKIYIVSIPLGLVLAQKLLKF